MSIFRKFMTCVAAISVGGLVLVACPPPAAELVYQDIHIADESIDFGMVPTGQSRSHTVLVHNAGDYDLTFTIPPELVDENGTGAFTLESDVELIPPRSSAEMTVTYVPVAEEEAWASISLYTNDPDEWHRVLIIQGSSFSGQPAISVSPALVEFGFVASGNSATKQVAITNVGDVPVDIVDITVGGSDTQFQVVEVPSFPIPVGEQALAEVEFHSDGGDHQLAPLTVEIADADNPYFQVNLSANSPGSTNNSAPIVQIVDPSTAKVFYSYQDLYVLAHVFDPQQPNMGLYCTLESSVLGMVEQNTSDADAMQVSFTMEIDETDFETSPGLHTLLLCCNDAFWADACDTAVISIDEEFSADDLDGDGYDPATGDCNEADDSAYPFAIEVADGVDNDCDTIIDEGTVNYDDDGDGFTEVGGDCNDEDTAIYPDAPEIPDFFDNDCDGTIDEGTYNYDDDADGFAETVGDCDDTNPDVYLGAPEICDGIDNNCNGTTDEDCIDNTPPLIMVGGIIADQVQITPNEVVNLSLTIVHGENAELVFDWGIDGGGEFTNVSEDGLQATWAPDGMGTVTIHCTVTDTGFDDPDDYLEEWDHVEITVSESIGIGGGPTDPGPGCNVGARSAAATPLALATVVALLPVLALRRRRDR